MRKYLPLLSFVVSLPFSSILLLAGPTLDKVRSAHELHCGINFEEAEYSTEDAHGNHSAFDIDLCKAFATAALGPNAKVIIVPFRDEQDALGGLKDGSIEVLATGSPNYRNSTAGFGFANPVFFDYQGLLVDKRLHTQTAKDFTGKKICFLGDTEIQNQLQGWMKRQNVAWLPFPFQEEGEMEAAFITHNCAAISADVSQLAYERIAFKSMAANFEILPLTVAVDPLAPTYRLDDPQWASLIQWTVNALVLAEASGITASNVEKMKSSDDLLIQRLLGTQHGYGQWIGLPDSWAADVIGAVGNYAELFDRDLGPKSAMKLDRGTNKLWTEGGLMLADPIR